MSISCGTNVKINIVIQKKNKVTDDGIYKFACDSQCKAKIVLVKILLRFEYTLNLPINVCLS